MSSGSTRVKTFIESLSDGAEFTSTMVVEALPGVSSGAVTGYLAKASQRGSIKVAGRNGNANIYAVVDATLLSARDVYGSGGAIGRTISRTSTDNTRIAELLRTLANQIEARPASLHDFTTAEILRELSRRDRVASKQEEE